MAKKWYMLASASKELNLKLRTDDTGMHQYDPADTDTITPCLSAPPTYVIIPGRSFRERSYFTQWVAHSIQG